MPTLSARDLKAILDLSLEVREFASLEEYRAGILPGLRRLVPADTAGYNEVDPVTGAVLFVGEPEDAFFDGIEQLFAALVDQHPLVARVAAGDGSTHTISEFLSAREFHGLELYQDMYKPLGAEDQIAFSLPGEAIIGIALNRSRRSFGDRDRAVLELLRPHLGQAYRRVRERALARTLIHALESSLEDADGGLLLLDPSGRIVHGSEPAFELLAAYLPDAAVASRAMLPPALTKCFERIGEERMAVQTARGQLVARRLAAPFPPGGWLVSLRERRANPPTVENLRQSFGLTRRQAEVLRLVCTGRENHQIARELQMSYATVRKHLERIYSRMGVSSRTAAVAAALGAGR